jgi:hypothetical protein
LSSRSSAMFSPWSREAYYNLQGAGNYQSYPMQDEPEGEVGFQRKMSLEGMAH